MKGIELKHLLKPETIKTFAKNGLRVAEKQAPALAAGVAIAGLIAAVVSAAKAGPACKEALEQAHIKKNEKALAERMDTENFSDETPIVDLTLKEKAPIYVKCYGKTFLLVLISGGCMVASVWFGNKQKAALTMLLTAAESRILDLEGATKAVVGEKKFDQITNAILDKKVETNPPMSGRIIDTGLGKTLCCEAITGTYYWSDIAAVKTAYADFYDMYLHSKQCTIEDLFNLLHIPVEYLPKMVEDCGYYLDEEEGIDYRPNYTPHSKNVTLDGVEYACFIEDMNRPKSYDQLMAEAYAKSQFRRWK